MRPSEVLDHQAALIDYLSSRAYRGYLERFVNDMVHKGKVVSSDLDMAQVLATSLTVAQAFHVQAEMMPLIRAASMDLDGLDALVHSRLPAEHGFLLFDDPVLDRDVWGDQVVLAGIQWMHSSAQIGDSFVPGIWIANYSDLTDKRDEVTQRLIEQQGLETLRTLGRFHVNHIWFLAYEEKVGPYDQPTPEDYIRFAHEGQALAETVPNNARLVVAIFRLLNQVMVEVKDAPIDRSSARRAKRMNLPARVQTIKLRRKETKFLTPSDPQPGSVEWQHSWWVRGSWQWRKCGAEHPFAEEYEKGHHARVYVQPHMKGPQDKPLVVSEKVWDFAR